MSYTVWTLRIGNKAFKDTIPVQLRVYPEVLNHTKGYLWWRKTTSEITGRWIIAYTFKRNDLLGVGETEYIYFDTEKEAQQWYDCTFVGVFLGKTAAAPKTPPPPPVKPKKPIRPGLHLV